MNLFLMKGGSSESLSTVDWSHEKSELRRWALSVGESEL
jgi:hypothetical protein